MEFFCCLRFHIFEAKILFRIQNLVYEPIFTFIVNQFIVNQIFTNLVYEPVFMCLSSFGNYSDRKN